MGGISFIGASSGIGGGSGSGIGSGNGAHSSMGSSSRVPASSLSIMAGGIGGGGGNRSNLSRGCGENSLILGKRAKGTKGSAIDNSGNFGHRCRLGYRYKLGNL